MSPLLPNVTNCQSAIDTGALPGAIATCQSDDMGDALLTFGDRLEHAMHEKGWDQKRLAAAVSLSEGGVSKHINARVAPRTLDTIERYCKALGINSEWLRKGTGPMKATPQASESPREAPILLGREALEVVLRDYTFPIHLDLAILDAIVADLRQEAAAEGASARPMGLWRAALEQRIARLSTRSGVLSRAGDHKK